MKQITADLLRVVMPTAGARADTFAVWMATFFPEYGIDSALRVAAFLGTIAEESGELKWTRELGGVDYFDKYEGREDLGNIIAGDGFKYRGRGLIQITGRTNYQAAQDALGQPYIEDPDLMRSPPEATRTACWWWQQHGCNDLAEVPDFRAVTRRVNGGLTHYDRRLEYYNRALAALREGGDS